MSKKLKTATYIAVALLISVGLYYYIAFYPIIYGYRYTSSDGGFSEFECPPKGQTYQLVLDRFDEYAASNGRDDVRLCIASKKRWYHPVFWYENLTHPRWDLPYKDTSEK